MADQLPVQNLNLAQEGINDNESVDSDEVRDERLASLEDTLRQFQERQQLVDETANTRKAKYPLPEPFDGDPAKLKTFLTKERAYQTKHGITTDAARVDHAMALLKDGPKGQPATWAQPFLDDYQLKPENQRQAATNRMFGAYAIFERELKTLFGRQNEAEEAEMKIFDLSQTKSASAYTVDFQQLAIQTGWNDDTLMALYVRGLKPEVRREFFKHGRPATMPQLKEAAVRIDNGLWFERKYNTTTQNKPNQGKPRGKPHQPKPKTTSEGGDAMDLDRVQTQKNRTQRGKQTGGGKRNPEKTKRFKDGACLGCGKKGHFIKDCNSKEVKVVDIGLVETNEPIRPTPWVHTKKEAELMGLLWEGATRDQDNVDKSIIYAGPQEGYNPGKNGVTERHHLHRKVAHDTGCNHDHYPGLRCSNCGEIEDDDPLCQGCLNDTRDIGTPEAHERAGTLASQCGEHWGNEERGYASIEPAKSCDEAGTEEVASGGEEDDGREKGLKIIEVGSESGRSGYEALMIGPRADSDSDTNPDGEIPSSATYFTLNIIPLREGGEAWFPERAATDIANFKELRQLDWDNALGHLELTWNDDRTYAPVTPEAPRAVIKIWGNAWSLGALAQGPPMEEPTDRTMPLHPEHGTISWVSCFWNNCHTHLRDKAVNGWLPSARGHTIERPYLATELKMWEVQETRRNEALVTPHPDWPVLCLTDHVSSAVDCQISRCRVHARNKAIATEAYFINERRLRGDFRVRLPDTPVQDTSQFINPRGLASSIHETNGTLVFDPREDPLDWGYPVEIPEGNY
jgi:hypothetical protein